MLQYSHSQHLLERYFHRHSESSNAKPLLVSLSLCCGSEAVLESLRFFKLIKIKCIFRNNSCIYSFPCTNTCRKGKENSKLCVSKDLWHCAKSDVKGNIKETFTLLFKLCHHLLTLTSFQICMTFSSKEHKRRYFEELVWFI